MVAQLLRSEGVALANVTALQATFQPVGSHRRRTMSPGLRHGIATRLLLNLVIADRGGRAQSLLDVTRLEQMAVTIGVIRPHPSETVGLELGLHRKRIAIRALLTMSAYLFHYTQQVLDVMTHLMG